MKFLLAIIAVCCVASAYAENPFGLSDAQMKAIAEIDPAKLPPILMAKMGDNTHWCCINDQPITTVQRTKTEKEIHTVATKVKTGYTSCGFMGTMRCSIYQTKYKHVAVYHEATYEVPEEGACQDHHVKCCSGYIEVAANCFSIDVLGGNMDVILQLINAGLIATAPPISRSY